MSSKIIKSEIKVNIPDYKYFGLFILDQLKRWHDDFIILDCDLDRRWTGQQISESSLNFAYHLITEIHLKPGDIVCFVCPDSDIHAIALIGVIFAGGIICSLPPLSTQRELENMITTFQPQYLVCDSDTYEIAVRFECQMSYIKKLFIIDKQSRKQLNLNCDTIEDIIEIQRSELSLPVIRSDSDIGVLITSSGSTGQSKAVILTNRNLLHRTYALQHEDFEMISRGDVMMSSCFFHSCGNNRLFQAIAFGATIALTRNNIWREKFLMIVEKYRIKTAFLVPSDLYYMIKNDEIVANYDLSSLQDVRISGAALSENIYQLAIKKFNFKKFRNGFGMTECSCATLVPISESKSLKNYKTIGRPVPGIEVKVIDSDGNTLPFNSIGEICIKGDVVTVGYFNNDEVNRNTFTRDGFLKSGDSGYYDEEGLFYMVGRYKDIIKIEGRVVSPAELESVLLNHSAVEDAAVIGIKDDKYDETPKAFVIIKHGFNVDEQSLIAYFNSSVESFKQINEIKILKEFPRTGIGKISKMKLKTMFYENK